jgi:hypothetical protein
MVSNTLSGSANLRGSKSAREQLGPAAGYVTYAGKESGLKVLLYAIVDVVETEERSS